MEDVTFATTGCGVWCSCGRDGGGNDGGCGTNIDIGGGGSMCAGGLDRADGSVCSLIEPSISFLIGG